MGEQPVLETERLILRPFTLADAPEVQRLAGDRAVASTTANIPHPYEDGMAEAWIGTHPEQFARGEAITFAITRREDEALLGAISLAINARSQRAVMGYWIGEPYWSQGYCTEAARAVLDYGFGALGLHRIHATHLTRNPASGRVMIKIGMQHEGHLREHVEKWGVFEDLEVYGILAGEHRPAGAA